MKFIPIVLYILAWIFALILHRAHPGAALWPYLLDYVFLLCVGIRFMWAFLVLCFMPEKLANMVGRQVSHFQYELGMMALALGVLGILCFVYPSLRLATAVAVIIYGLGQAYGYVLEMARNQGKNSAGVVAFAGVLISLTLLVGIGLPYLH
jgi:hypothetical protein